MTPRLPAAIAASLLALGALSACGGSKNADIPTTPVDLTLGEDAFSPTMITEAPGATIYVVNPGTMTHNVVVNGGLEKTPPILGGTHTTFLAPTKPGTYKLTCDYHPDMLATLVVT